LLKLSCEIQGKNPEPLGEILEETLSEFSLSKEDLNRYIEAHKPELMEEARKFSF